MSEIKAKGIDVSNWNGVLDWTKVKAAGINFAIIRAGYGKGNIDSKFKTNVDGAVAAGIDIGAYWFSYAKTVADAKAEADYLCDAVASTGAKFTYPLCYDYEYDSYNKAVATGQTPTNALIVQMAEAFLKRVEERGYYAANYSNIDYLGKGFSMLVDRYDLWLAQWSSSKTRDCGIWQYASDGKIHGCSGVFDMNYSYKDYPAIMKQYGLNGFSKPSPADETVVKEGMKVGICTAAQSVEAMQYWLGYCEKASSKYVSRRDKDVFELDKGSANMTYAGYYCGVQGGAWCAMMVSTAIAEACGNSKEYAKKVMHGLWPYTACNQLYDAAPAAYKGRRGSWTPARGDVIVFSSNGSTREHTGMVEDCDGLYVYTIEGNKSNMCKRCTYKLTDSYIYGYVRPLYSDAKTGGTTGGTSYPTLKYGATGADVVALQKKLISLGYSCGSAGADGEFGAATLAAVKLFQKKNGLEADGIVGPQTWNALNKDSAIKNNADQTTDTSTSSSAIPHTLLKKGARGDEVKVLQRRLNELGYACGTVDGVFGGRTYAAVRAFQKDHGLLIDGEVGPQTWKALGV